MVHLNRICTKTGDSGQTSLGNGVRVPKTHPRIVACGCIDELNAAVGVCLTIDLPAPFADWLRQIQNDLFDLGADMSVPEAAEPARQPRLRITPDYVSRLEGWLNGVNQALPPLDSFILPGGTPASAHLHLLRTVCRRAELVAWQLAQQEPVNTHLLVYLNRLSDLFFVLARACHAGSDEQRWRPKT